MTSPTGTCLLRPFDPDIRADLYFSECAGQALDTACQTGWQRSKTGDVFDVAAAVAVGGMRKGSWDCDANECSVLGSRATAAAGMDDLQPYSTMPTSVSTNYYSDHGGIGGDGGVGGASATGKEGVVGWDGRARDDDRKGLAIERVDEEGKFIRLVNDSSTQDEEIGCCILRQAFQGHSIIEFHFPPAIFLPAGSSVTVWSSGRAEAGAERPPNDDDEPHWNFQFKELFRWANGHDYLTTLCRSNGQVLASSSQSFGSYGGNPSDKSIGPSPGIISKFNLITNRYKLKQDQERAARGSVSVDFTERLKKQTVHRFQPRVIRRDGAQTKPKGGRVRQSPSYQPDRCFPLIYPD